MVRGTWRWEQLALERRCHSANDNCRGMLFAGHLLLLWPVRLSQRVEPGCHAL